VEAFYLSHSLSRPLLPTSVVDQVDVAVREDAIVFPHYLREVPKNYFAEVGEEREK